MSLLSRTPSSRQLQRAADLTTLQSNVTAAVKYAMQEGGYTHETFAQRAGVTSSLLSQLLDTTGRDLTLQELVLFSEALDLQWAVSLEPRP